MADTSLAFNIIGRDRTGPAFASAERHVSHLGEVTSKLGTVTKGAFLGLGAGIVALGTAGATMGIKTAASLEQAQIGFTSLIGSAKGAQDFLSQLQTFAAATPFDLPGLIDSSRKLLGVGMAAKDVVPFLTDFGDAAGAVGISADQFSGVVLAMSQAIGAGRFMTADLNQVMNNGIPVWTILSKAMGKPVPELRQMASKGQLLAKDVLPALQKEMHKDYGGSMAKQSKTLTGLWSTLMDTINIGLANAIKPLEPALKSGLSGAIGIATRAFSGLNSGIAKLKPKFDEVMSVITTKVIPEFGRLKDKVAGALDRIDFGGLKKKFTDQAGGWAGSIIDGLRQGFDNGNWGPLGKSLGDGLGTAVRNISLGTIKLGDLVLKAMGNIDWFAVGTKSAKGFLEFVLGFAQSALDPGMWLRVFKEHIGAVVVIAGSVLTDGLGTGLFTKIGSKLEQGGLIAKLFGKIIGKLPEASRRLVGAFAKLAGDIAKGFVTGIRRVFPEFGRAAEGAFGRFLVEAKSRAAGTIMWLRGLPGKFVSALAALPGKLAQFAGQAIAGLLRGLAGKFPSVTAWFRAMPGQILGALGAGATVLFQYGVDLIQGFINGIVSKAGDIASTIKDKVVGVAQSALHLGGLFGSPSRLTMKYGKWWTDGFVIGMKAKKADVLQQAQDMVQALKDKIQTVKDFAKSIRDAFASFGDFSGIDSQYGLAYSIGQLRDKANSATAFASGITKLRKMGLNETTLSQLRDAGPDAIGSVQNLLGGGASGIATVNSLMGQIKRAGRGLGNREAKAEYGLDLTKKQKITVASGKQTVHLTIDSKGDVGDALLAILRKSIRAKGGKVQVVLGTGKA